MSRATTRRATPTAIRRGTVPASKLATAVAKLDRLKDEHDDRLAEAARLLDVLAESGAYKQAGYASAGELRARISSSLNIVGALLPAPEPESPASGVFASAPPPIPRRSGEAAVPRDHALLTLIATTLRRLRAIEAETDKRLEAVRDQLTTIETERLYEECGYTCFSDFRKRALAGDAMVGLALEGAEVVKKPESETESETETESESATVADAETEQVSETAPVEEQEHGLARERELEQERERALAQERELERQREDERELELQREGEALPMAEMESQPEPASESVVEPQREIVPEVSAAAEKSTEKTSVKVAGKPRPKRIALTLAIAALASVGGAFLGLYQSGESLASIGNVSSFAAKTVKEEEANEGAEKGATEHVVEHTKEEAASAGSTKATPIMAAAKTHH